MYFDHNMQLYLARAGDISPLEIMVNVAVIEDEITWLLDRETRESIQDEVRGLSELRRQFQELLAAAKGQVDGPV